MMKEMVRLPKLKKGDKVAILSPSFAAPGRFPHVYELGLKRLREVFELEPVEFPTTKKLGAAGEERAADLVAAFEDPSIKGIISSIGGNDQVTYIKNLPPEPFMKNPKPFFGYSDNTHFANFLWMHGVPSFYGGALFTQFAMEGKIDDFTLKHLKWALFESGERELEASPVYNDIGLDWNDPKNLEKQETFLPNDGWHWDGTENAEGISWGGCLESIDELLRHNIAIPPLSDFENVILFTETSEEMPSADYVFRVYRALGERGVLARVRGILVGRPKSWEFGNEHDETWQTNHRIEQRETILKVVRMYNPNVPVIQNMDFGHTSPQIPLPYGSNIRINAQSRKIFMTL
ncbi:MAG: S66 peptidase family protein [Candidatus Paceibacterota bacterium]|jgi:muramoyltetrapeptide carboxypeptidase LdcA involved in peptidoglycan recycling